jgi:hypothetical protein
LGVGHEVPAGAPIDRKDVLVQNSVLAFAFALARARNGASSLSVLDRGGAPGHFYVLARQLFPVWSSIILAESCQQSAPKGSEMVPRPSTTPTSTSSVATTW